MKMKKAIWTMTLILVIFNDSNRRFCLDRAVDVSMFGIRCFELVNEFKKSIE